VVEIQLVIYDGTSRGNWMAVARHSEDTRNQFPENLLPQFASRMRPLRSITALSALRSF